MLASISTQDRFSPKDETPSLRHERKNNIGDKSTRQHRAQTKDYFLCLCCFSCQEFVKMHCDRNVAFIDPGAFIERGEREREDLATDPASSDMASKFPLGCSKSHIGRVLSIQLPICFLLYNTLGFMYRPPLAIGLCLFRINGSDTRGMWDIYVLPVGLPRKIKITS